MPYWTRRHAASQITEEFFEVAPRTLLTWCEVPIVYLNGKAHGKEEDWRRAAAKRLHEQLQRQGAADLAVLKSAARAGAARCRRSIATTSGV